MSEETPSTNIDETTSPEETAASNTEQTISAGETSTTNTETQALAPLSTGKPRRILTAAELAARHANAQKCTGPRTLEGKLRSSRNALKHGFYCGQSAFYWNGWRRFRAVSTSKNPSAHLAESRAGARRGPRAANPSRRRE
jgi:hypothetical protein